MKIEDAIVDFMGFWNVHFSERGDREKFLCEINDRLEGVGSQRPDAEMPSYQDRVAASYGIYEEDWLQRDTMLRLWQNIFGRNMVLPIAHLVSIGCGPASYELWLLSKGLVGRVTLVDHSPAMLERARGIADKLGLADRVTIIEADATKNGLPDSCADLVFCINSMHWSKDWKRWIRETWRIAKPKAPIFLSCTLGHPRSKIEPSALGQMARDVCAVENYGTIQDVQAFATMPGNSLVALVFRFFVFGRCKKDLTSSSAGKNKKKKKK